MHVSEVIYRISDERLGVGVAEGAVLRDKAAQLIHEKYDHAYDTGIKVTVYNNDAESDVEIRTGASKNRLPITLPEIEQALSMQNEALKWLDTLSERLKKEV